MTTTTITTIPRSSAESADIERPRSQSDTGGFDTALARAAAQSAHVRTVIRAPQDDAQAKLTGDRAERASLVGETGNQIVEQAHERIAREGSLTPIAQLASQQMTEGVERPPAADQPAKSIQPKQQPTQPQPRAQQAPANTARAEQPTAAVQSSAPVPQPQTAAPTTETTPSQQASASQASPVPQAAPAQQQSSSSGQQNQQPSSKPAAAITGAKAVAKPGGPQNQNAFSSSLRRAAQMTRSRIAAPAQKTPFQFDQAKLEAQAARGLAAALKQRGGEVTMRLNPASLGMLKVRVQMRSGVVDASFEPSTEQARELLESNLTSLRAALESRGLTVERLSIAEPPTQDASERGTVGDDRGSEDPAEDRPNQHAGDNGAGRTTPRGHATDGEHAPDDPASLAPGVREHPEFVGGAGIAIRLDTVV